MERNIVIVKSIIVIGLAAWVAVWWGGPSALSGADDRIAQLESRIDGLSLADLEGRLGELGSRVDRLSRDLRSDRALPRSRPGTARPANASGNPSVADGAPRIDPEKLYNSPERRRARMQLNLVERHVEGLSKEQLTGLEEIFIEAHEREAKELAKLSGTPDLARTFQPIREQIMVDRYNRLRDLLDPVQLGQLVDRVPIPIVPRSISEKEGR